jgi:hypothetical protein
VKGENTMKEIYGNMTAKDIRDYCKNHLCTPHCDFYDYETQGCIFKGTPYAWRMKDIPNFTEDEIRKAKAIRELFDYNILTRYDDNTLYIGNHEIALAMIRLSDDIFPSIKPCKSYSLDEIIGNN